MPYCRLTWSDGQYSLREVGTEEKPADFEWNNEWVYLSARQVRAWEAVMDQLSVLDMLLSTLSNDRYRECESFRDACAEKPETCPGYVFSFGGPCHICKRAKIDHRVK